MSVTAARLPNNAAEDGSSSDDHRPGAESSRWRRVRRRYPWVETWAVPGVPALATLAVVLVGLTRRQLWRDEFATWVSSTKSWSDLVQLIEHQDVVLAPYYAFMHGWISIFGNSTASMRMPSVLAVAGCAALTAAIGRRIFNPATGVIAGLLFALLPPVSRFGTEVRPYAMAIAATALATLLLLRAIEVPTWTRWAAYSAAVALVGWTHLVAMLVLLAHAAFVAASWRDDRRAARWLVAAVVGVAPALPLIVIGHRQAAQVSWIPTPTWQATIFETTGVTGVGAVVFGLALLGCWPLSRRTALLATWAAAPFVLLYLGRHIVSFFLHRYLLFTLPAWCLLAAAAVALFAASAVPSTDRGWRRHLFPAAVVAACLGAGLPAQQAARDVVSTNEPDNRGISVILDHSELAGDMIGYHGRYPWWSETAMRYYLPTSRLLPTAFIAVTGSAPTIATNCGSGHTCLDQATRLWLINTEVSADPVERMDAEFVKELNQRYQPMRIYRLKNVTLSLWAVRQTP